MIAVEYVLLGGSILLLLSIVSTKLAERFSVPALLLFLLLGILAGSEGVGGIYFNDPWLAQLIGTLALVFIIFLGGIDATWKEIRPVLLPGVILSSLGVVLTAAILGWAAVIILKFSLWEGLLLGAIVSSTDAAAVFSILRSKRVRLKGGLQSLLELESGSNDPMAVFLTLSFLSLLTGKFSSPVLLIPSIVWEMSIGFLIGMFFARMSLAIFQRLRLDYGGLYPVLMMALVVLTYGIAATVKGNGYLAVYVMGLWMGRQNFLYKKSVVRFYEGLAWLMQIAMFLTLGLLVFPSHIWPVAGAGLLIAAILMFVARPLSIFICLAPFKIDFRKKVLIAWVGLRGAVPIILATFPLLAGIAKAEIIFNMVFFVVLASILVQGTSLAFVARLLKLESPLGNRRHYPIEFEKTEGIDADLTELIVPFDSAAIGKSILELDIPRDCLIILIAREERFIIVNGLTTIESGDVLQVLANTHDLRLLQKKLAPESVLR